MNKIKSEKNWAFIILVAALIALAAIMIYVITDVTVNTVSVQAEQKKEQEYTLYVDNNKVTEFTARNIYQDTGSDKAYARYDIDKNEYIIVANGTVEYVHDGVTEMYTGSCSVRTAD